MRKKLAIITGASSGIGKVISQSLQQRDYKLVLLGRNTDRLKALSKELKDSEFFQCDLEKNEQILKFCLNLKKNFENKGFEKVVLVNNAGMITRNPFFQSNASDWQKQFQVNFFGPALLTQNLLGFLKTQSEARIVNISSTLAIRPIKETSIYSSSKAALNSLTQSLALELAEFKIPVNAVCPGIIETPIHSFYQTEDQKLRENLNQSQPSGRIGQPEDVANLVQYFCEQASPWITGTLMPVDGGILLNS